MSYTTQCHQPEPVGASGSYTVKAKLLVPAGAPLHVSGGEMFLPLQPKPLKTCSLASVAVRRHHRTLEFEGIVRRGGAERSDDEHGGGEPTAAPHAT